MEPIDREILEAVAEGRMSPDEAAARLEQAAARPADVGAPPPRAEPLRSEPRARRVRISAAARTVRVTGDPSVSEAEVDGPHRVWREAEDLIISGGGGNR